jgi:hypothetical protein
MSDEIAAEEAQREDAPREEAPREERRDTRDEEGQDPDKESALRQLYEGGALRHSLDPAVSDFTGIDPEKLDEMLRGWQAQGVIHNWIPNDTSEDDGVQNRWQLGINGLAMCKDYGIGAPTITGLNPATGPANADASVEIEGKGFEEGATVEIGNAYGLEPTAVSPTSISVTFEAINIEQPGTLPVKVRNNDGQTSNSLDFVVT